MKSTVLTIARYFWSSTSKLCLAALLLIASCSKEPSAWVPPTDEPSEPSQWPSEATVYGTVTCEGKPIEGTLISDGVLFASTDAEGRYSLASKKHHGYVFLITPSGYETISDGILPSFFVKAASPKPEEASFRLRKVDQSRYKMLFFGDMHLAGRRFCHDVDQFREFGKEVSAFTAAAGVPVYALTLGDMAWDYFWGANGYDLNSYLTEVQRDIRGLQLFHTMGNHDNDPSQTGDFMGEFTYKSIIGPNYYSFNIGGVHYIVLDDMIYYNNDGNRNFSATLSQEQLSFVEKDLSYVDPSVPVVVTMHAPLYTKDGTARLKNTAAVEKLFKGRKTLFVTGHMHTIHNIDKGTLYESNSGAVCAAWWMTSGACYEGIHIGTDGTPGGYRIMDVSSGEYSWVYKGTGLPENEQFRVYDRNELRLDEQSWVSHASTADKAAFASSVGDYALASSDNELLINIWDYDPSWNISVLENGKPLSVEQLFDVRDPLYLAAYEAYEYENGYSVSYPSSTTNHIFKATASAPDTPIEVSVTDRFGTRYSETVQRPRPFTIEQYKNKK